MQNRQTPDRSGAYWKTVSYTSQLPPLARARARRSACLPSSNHPLRSSSSYLNSTAGLLPISQSGHSTCAAPVGSIELDKQAAPGGYGEALVGHRDAFDRAEQRSPQSQGRLAAVQDDLRPAFAMPVSKSVSYPNPALTRFSCASTFRYQTAREIRVLRNEETATRFHSIFDRWSISATRCGRPVATADDAITRQAVVTIAAVCCK
jgi:hypothetical protein